MKSWLVLLLAASFLNLACGTKSRDQAKEDRGRKPIDIIIPEELKDKSFNFEFVELSAKALFPANVTDVTDVLGRVIEEKDVENNLWPAFLKTERACVKGTVAEYFPVATAVGQASGVTKFQTAQKAYSFLLPYDSSFFSKQEDQSAWLPDFAKLATLVSKTESDKGYDSAYYQLRGNRLNKSIFQMATWNSECGELPNAVEPKRRYSSLVSLGLQFSLVLKITSSEGVFGKTPLESPAYDIMFGSLGLQKETENLLVSKKAHITLVWAQLGGDPAPFRKILAASQCQIYALNKCQETVSEIQKEINSQQAFDKESDSFHWAPLLIKFDAI